MAGFKSMMKDTVFIIKNNGERIGPYKASVSSNSITIFEEAIDVDDGDHAARTIPSGKEELYLILSADYSPGLSSIPPHYTLKVRRTTALDVEKNSMHSTTVNIHNSSGFQVGDYNTQNIQATFNELIHQIDKSSASLEEKAEAKGRLDSFLRHPLVSSVLGGTTGVILSVLAGS